MAAETASFTGLLRPSRASSTTSAVRSASSVDLTSVEDVSRFGDRFCDFVRKPESQETLQSAPLKLLRILALALIRSDGLYISTLITVVQKGLAHVTRDVAAQKQYEAASAASGIKFSKIPPGRFIGDTRRYLALVPIAITIVMHAERAELERATRFMALRLGKVPHSGDYQWAMELLPLIAEETATIDAGPICHELGQLPAEARASRLAQLNERELEAVVRNMAPRTNDRTALEKAAELLIAASEGAENADLDNGSINGSRNGSLSGSLNGPAHYPW